MLIYMSLKMWLWRDIASDRLLPSITSCLSNLLTSLGIPLDCRCVMLFNATVSGMPEFSRFASCWVKVASSPNFGRRFRFRNPRNTAGIRLEDVGGRSPLRLTPAAAPRPPSTMIGNKPMRSICSSAVERSATSRIPCTSSPERLRALYVN